MQKGLEKVRLNILKALLWDHFEKILPESQKGQGQTRIADITFGKQKIRDTEELIALYKKYEKLKKLRASDRNSKKHGLKR